MTPHEFLLQWRVWLPHAIFLYVFWLVFTAGFVLAVASVRPTLRIIVQHIINATVIPVCLMLAASEGLFFISTVLLVGIAIGTSVVRRYQPLVANTMHISGLWAHSALAVAVLSTWIFPQQWMLLGLVNGVHALLMLAVLRWVFPRPTLALVPVDES